MDRGARCTTVRRVTELDTTEQLTLSNGHDMRVGTQQKYEYFSRLYLLFWLWFAREFRKCLKIKEKKFKLATTSRTTQK